MDEHRKQELKAKLSELRQKQAEMQRQIEIDQITKKFEPISSLFIEKNIKFEILQLLTTGEYKEKFKQTYEYWLSSNFPFEPWGRIAESKVRYSRRYKTSKFVYDYQYLLQEFIKLEGLDADQKVIVLWYSVNTPVLKLKLTDVVNNAESIFQFDWDTWIFSQEMYWCIEHYHEGEITYYKNPPV
jgi:hypothetical protein